MMRDNELTVADSLMVGARGKVGSGRPSAARADVLRARSMYEDLQRPWDVAVADVALGAQNIHVAESRDGAWERLLADVAWTPGPVPPLPSLMVRCLGGEHEVAMNHEWRLSPQVSPEHVAAALVGQEPYCARLAREVERAREWAGMCQRLRPSAVSWSEPDLELCEAPALDLSESVDDGDPSALPLPEGSWGELLSHLQPARPPEVASQRAAPLVVGGVAAVDWLWWRGVHPELLIAIHAAVGVGEPIDPTTVARLVARRVMHLGVLEWCDDPLPVGCLVELLDDSQGKQRLSMLRFLAAAGGSRDADDPSRLVRWWDAEDLPERLRVTLHRAGFERPDLTRWAANWGVSEAALATVLRERPPARWPLMLWGDPALHLSQQHLAHAEARAGSVCECGEWVSLLAEAVVGGDLKTILRLAEVIDKHHPESDPRRGECPIWITSRVQAMVALHDGDRGASAELLGALRSVPQIARTEPLQSLLDEAEWVWMALERQEGRMIATLPDDEGDESAARLYSLLEQGHTPQDAPRAQWSEFFGPVINQVWNRLRMSGVTLEQAIRWMPAGASSDYVLWLADYQPYPWPVGPPHSDHIGWLIAEARRRARRWAAGELHRESAGADSSTRTCVRELQPALEAALAGNDPVKVDIATREALDGHTYYRGSSRYHVDSCPVDQLARLVLGVQTYPTQRQTAFELLTGDRDDPREGIVQDRYPSALCMVGWLASNLDDGRLVRDDPLVVKWRAAADRSVDGRWLLRMALEAAASAGGG